MALSSLSAHAVKVCAEKLPVFDGKLPIRAHKLLLRFGEARVAQGIFLVVEKVGEADIQAHAQLFERRDRGAGVSKEAVVEA